MTEDRQGLAFPDFSMKTGTIGGCDVTPKALGSTGPRWRLREVRYRDSDWVLVKKALGVRS